MLAALFNGPHHIEVKDISLPEINEDEVLIKVEVCGVCGTDFHIFDGQAPAKNNVVLGHEYSGIIEKTGSKATGFKPGDKVVINPNIHCGYCEYCKKGKINFCSNLKALGVTINGGFAEFSKAPLTQIYKLPDSFSLNDAALAEPLSCCLHGIDQADIKLGDNVAIVGTGTIGLLMIQLARLKGALNIVAIDISDDKLKLAKLAGANILINSINNPINNINDFIDFSLDRVIECAGNEESVSTAFLIVKKGGTVVVFGLASPEASFRLPLQEFFHKEIVLKSSLLNPFTFQTAVDLLVSNKINHSLLSKKFISLNQNNLNNLFSGEKDKKIAKYFITPNQ